VHHVAKRAVVDADAGRQIEGGVAARAPVTAIAIRPADRGGDLIAALRAMRWRDQFDRTPAQPAHGAREWRIERTIARRTSGCEQGAQNSVGGGEPHAAG
jgi:hypothetical protein